MATTTTVVVSPRRTRLPRQVRRGGWTIGVWALLIAMVGWYSSQIPQFGAFELTSITKGSIPLVCLAIGQAAIVIGGGVDLGLGAVMLLANVTAARAMEGKSFAAVIVIGLIVLVGAASVEALVGWVVSVSGVPDIVVTLATSYIWSGVALKVLPSPGGGTADRLRWLFTGDPSGFSENPIVPLIVMAVAVAAAAMILRRTTTGLSIYAIGSNQVAARLAGVDERRARIASYSVGGLFAGLAGLANLGVTGSGDARFSIGAGATLNSVAAVVLGGVALSGGSGSALGVVAAAIILFLLTPLLSALGVDSNNAQVVQGLLIAVVMMVGGLHHLRRQRAS